MVGIEVDEGGGGAGAAHAGAAVGGIVAIAPEAEVCVGAAEGGATVEEMGGVPGVEWLGGWGRASDPVMQSQTGRSAVHAVGHMKRVSASVWDPKRAEHMCEGSFIPVVLLSAHLLLALPPTVVLVAATPSSKPSISMQLLWLLLLPSRLMARLRLLSPTCVGWSHEAPPRPQCQNPERGMLLSKIRVPRTAGKKSLYLPLCLRTGQ